MKCESAMEHDPYTPPKLLVTYHMLYFNLNTLTQSVAPSISVCLIHSQRERLSTGYQPPSGRLARSRSREGPGPTASKMSQSLPLLGPTASSVLGGSPDPAARASGVSLALRGFGAIAERQKSLNLCWARSALDEPSCVGPKQRYLCEAWESCWVLNTDQTRETQSHCRNKSAAAC